MKYDIELDFSSKEWVVFDTTTGEDMFRSMKHSDALNKLDDLNGE